MANADPSMVQEAQRIWEMLDDMAENDPQSYKKFIEKQMKEGKESMKPPQPHMCVQTSIIGDCPLFINICEWNKIPEPKSDEHPIPVTGGHMYEGKDQNGRHKLLTVAFGPGVLRQFGRDSGLTAERRLLINLAMDYIQDQCQVKVSRSFVILPNDQLFKGPKHKVKSTLLDKLGGASSELEELQELENTFGPLPSSCKDSLLKEMSEITLDGDAENEFEPLAPKKREIHILDSEATQSAKKKGLIEEVSSSVNQNKEPDYKMEIIERTETDSGKIVLRIQLPGIKTVADCLLDISEDDVQLEAGDQYELKLKLPRRIQEENAAAKFSKKSSTLTLTLPLV